jgi:hypothetical protein
MFKKALLILPIALAISANSFAGNYVCPKPSEILQVKMIDDPVFSWSLLVAPAMPTSKGMSFLGTAWGVYSDGSIPPFESSSPTTIMVNGVPTPGYSCDYVKLSATPLTQDERDQINHLPENIRRKAQKFAAQGFSFSFAEVEYFLK